MSGARMAQTAPNPYRPAGVTDCMIECDECESEWAWGAPVETIERLIAEHNTERHQEPRDNGGHS